MGEVIYNGRSSKDIGLEVETFPEYEAPKRSYEKIHIPGRNGDLLIDNGCWENVSRKYSVSIGSYDRLYDEMANKVSEWLNSSISYARLEDSYEPEYYRLAVYHGSFSMTNIFNHGGKSTIEFDCKPQRFLKIGDIPISVTSTMAINNPTNFESLPIIKIYGSGSGEIVFGTCRVTVTEVGGQLILDCELQDAYLNNTNKNSVIKVPNGFPKMNVGETPIGFSGGVNRLEVIPKWYTL